jgi:hypothetical protein
MPAGAKRNRLDIWVSKQLPARFETRVLPIDAETADTWGRGFSYLAPVLAGVFAGLVAGAKKVPSTSTMSS